MEKVVVRPAIGSLGSVLVVAALAACGGEKKDADKAEPVEQKNDGPTLTAAECTAEVAKLKPWVAAVAAEGEVNDAYNVDRVAIDKRAEASQWVDVVVVGKDLVTFEGAPFDIAKTHTDVDGDARLAELRDALRSSRDKMLAHRDKLPSDHPDDLIAFEIDKAAPYGAVVNSILGAADAGYKRFELRFDGTSAVKEPPASAYTATAKKLSAPPDPSKKVAILARGVPKGPHPLFTRCLPVHELLGSLSTLRREDKLSKFAAEFPSAIEACGCAVDMPSVRTYVWMLFGRYSGSPTTSVTVSIAAAKGGAEIKHHVDTPWSKTHKDFVAAAAEPGGAVTFVEYVGEP